MKIKICGLFREEDIDYVNEARPDYCGFVFAQSRRQVSPAQASRLRWRLAEGIVPVGVFINATVEDIAALYRDGVIDIAQLHGGESGEYIDRLKEASGDTPIPVIKVIKVSPHNLTQRHGDTEADKELQNSVPLCLRERQFKDSDADYFLFDSGAGSGKPFDWELLISPQSQVHSPKSPFKKPWFLAGGIGVDNIKQAMALNPFAIDASSGAETDGVKDRAKILRLTEIVRKGNKE